MRAVEMDGNGEFALAEYEEPVPRPGELLIGVRAISVNRGEVLRARSADPGFRPGWDFAGVVLDKRTDAGPAVGARVAGYLTSGAWAERLAVMPGQVAELPDGFSFKEAAALPVAGLTALGAIDAGGGVLGRKVMVTGASGGVGCFAVHLAVLSGAEVTAVVRRSVEECRPLFPHGTRVLSLQSGLAGAAEFGPFDLVIETVGGQTLGDAMGMLAPSGKCVTLGVTDQPRTTFDAERFFMTGTATLEGFVLFRDRKAAPSEGLGRLLQLVGRGALPVVVGLSDCWENVGRVAETLLTRGFTGKAVLSLGDEADAV